MEDFDFVQINSTTTPPVGRFKHLFHDKRYYVGYLADLLQLLSELLHFDYVINSSPDGSYGFQKSDGSWDGVIGELVRGVCIC